MRSRTLLLGMMLIPVISAFAQAAPVQVSRSQFYSDIANSNFGTMTETFDSFPYTNYLTLEDFLATAFTSSPIANGTASVQAPGEARFSIDNFLSLGAKMLKPGGNGSVVSTFSDFPSGTTLWAVDGLYNGYLPFGGFTDFDFSVTGNSGTLQFTLRIGVNNANSLPNFMGFYDPSGLTSVSVTHHESTDFLTIERVMVPPVIDTIVTAGPQIVPEPSALILGGTVACFAGCRRHRTGH